MTVHVVAYDTENPADTRELSRALSQFDVSRVRRIALLVKTEGNAEVNDFSRELAMLATGQALTSWGGAQVLGRTTFLISTGCEGAMTPFGYLFADVDDNLEPAQAKALAIGCARSRSLKSAEIGTTAHADIAAEAVRDAMKDAGVNVKDVALVIVKTPIMSLAYAEGAGGARITSAHSKAVGALGAGLALGEVERSKIVQDAIDRDLTLFARRAMVFSGSELDCVEVLLLANKAGAAGNLYVQTGSFSDVLDAHAIRQSLREAGCEIDAQGCVADPTRVVAMLVKGGVSPDGRLRGYRTTITSSHIDMDKHVRATLSGVVGSILGSCRIFISANTVHQAPAGAGLCACIVRRSR
jgi:cyanuric acid amidohydrolase